MESLNQFQRILLCSQMTRRGIGKRIGRRIGRRIEKRIWRKIGKKIERRTMRKIRRRIEKKVAPMLKHKSAPETYSAIGCLCGDHRVVTIPLL